MARWALACVVILIVGGCGGGERERAKKPTGPRLTAKMSRALDATLREQVASTGVPGASAAIVFPDGRQWRGAAGDAVINPKRAMTPNTAVPFDGVTNVATAALALRLVEQGRLRLEDRITRWYPVWRGDSRATVRDLLGHTAGTRDPDFERYPELWPGQRSRVTARRLLAAAPKPGPRTKTAQYSNTGFMIAGAVLRRAGGEPVATAIRRELFNRPGSDGLAFQPAERPHAPRAHAYSYPRGGAIPTDASDGSPYLPFRVWPTVWGTAGALAGDVPSLARWGHELFSGRIIKPSSVREMLRFHPSADWEAYGLGVALDSIDGRDAWGHTGDGFGSHTEFWHLPRQHLTLAVTWNDDLLDRRAGIHLRSSPPPSARADQREARPRFGIGRAVANR